jgi:hypothetical protein
VNVPATARADSAVMSRPSCASCKHFRSDPIAIEQLVPGLRSFGSGFASVRSDDGLCLRHARYLSAAAHCAQFEHERRHSRA